MNHSLAKAGTRLSQDKIAISAEHRAQLRRALDAALPRECCGVLLGGSVHDRLVVRRVLITLNATTMIGGFCIPDHEIRRVRSLSAQWGQPIVAVFHSHPDGSGAFAKGKVQENGSMSTTCICSR